jgi:cell division protein FtsQ
MKKSPARHPSRLAPQRPVRKTRLISRRGSQNNYRRNRFKRNYRQTWVRALVGIFGLVTLAGLSLGLVVGYHHLLTSSTFCIKDINDIEIEGAKHLSRRAVLQQARLGPGINLLAMQPAQVERALMAHPWIAKAELSRKWPHRIQIWIQERVPIALAQVGERLYYVDRQGTLFKPLSPGDPHNFPVITGLKPEQFQPVAGALPEVVAQAFQLLDVLKKTSPPLNLGNISEVHVDLVRGFTLYANGLGAGLDLGFKNYSAKLRKFAQLWPVLVHKGLLAKIGRINLNYPHRVLVTLKGVEENP